ncbi:hypothetical protein [Streptomyces sp. NPDC046805]
MAGFAAVWVPPLASLAILDVILIVTATVLGHVHRNLTRTLRAAAES